MIRIPIKKCKLNMASGGFRKNAKRPLKYGEPMVSVTIRVPKSKRELIKKIVKDELRKYIIKRKPTK